MPQKRKRRTEILLFQVPQPPPHQHRPRLHLCLVHLLVQAHPVWITLLPVQALPLVKIALIFSWNQYDLLTSRKKICYYYYSFFYFFRENNIEIISGSTSASTSAGTGNRQSPSSAEIQQMARMEADSAEEDDDIEASLGLDERNYDERVGEGNRMR